MVDDRQLHSLNVFQNRASTSQVTSVALSGDGQILVTCFNWGTVIVWDAATGEKLHVIPPDPGCSVIGLSGDGKSMCTTTRGYIQPSHSDTDFSGSNSTLTTDETVRLWDLAKLYRARWNNELDLRSIKSVMKMECLRCPTPEMVRKEIWTHTLAYNLIRTIMAQVAVRSPNHQFQRNIANARSLSVVDRDARPSFFNRAMDVLRAGLERHHAAEGVPQISIGDSGICSSYYVAQVFSFPVSMSCFGLTPASLHSK